MDRGRNENIRQTCRIDKINDWVLERKKEWNKHIDLMTEERKNCKNSKGQITGRTKEDWKI